MIEVFRVKKVTSIQGEKGDKGDQGNPGDFGGATFRYLLDTTSQSKSDPGEGKLKFNDSTQNLTQEFYIDSSANLNDLNIDNFLTTLDSVTSNIKGFVRLTKQNSSSDYIQFQISDVVNHNGWWSGDVIVQESSSDNPFTNGDDLIVSFLTNGSRGDKGDRGFTGFQGYTGYQGFTGFQGFTGLGYQGYTGYQGVRGFTGFQGFTGNQGFTGFQGLQGDKGDTGDQGLQGRCRSSGRKRR